MEDRLMTIKDLSQQLGTKLPDADELLRWIGLQQQRSANDAAFTMIGAFALGTIVGGALALLFAPKPGHELRHDLGERLDGATQRIKEQLTPSDSSKSPDAQHLA
jgi:YtxH-like protein